MKLELERECVAIAIEIVVGYLCKEAHGHQGCNAVPPELSKVLKRVNYDKGRAAVILVAQYGLQHHVGHATPPDPPVDCAWWNAALKRRVDTTVLALHEYILLASRSMTSSICTQKAMHPEITSAMQAASGSVNTLGAAAFMLVSRHSICTSTPSQLVEHCEWWSNVSEHYNGKWPPQNPISNGLDLLQATIDGARVLQAWQTQLAKECTLQETKRKRKLKRKLCSITDCTTQSRSGGMCSKHGKRCTQEGCDKSACDGSVLCIGHGGGVRAACM